MHLHCLGRIDLQLIQEQQRISGEKERKVGFKSYDHLAVEELLGHNGGKTTEKVAPTIDNELSVLDVIGHISRERERKKRACGRTRDTQGERKRKKTSSAILPLYLFHTTNKKSDIVYFNPNNIPPLQNRFSLGIIILGAVPFLFIKAEVLKMEEVQYFPLSTGIHHRTALSNISFSPPPKTKKKSPLRPIV